jgi:hypothetical protein
MYQTIMAMLHTAELDMANSVNESGIADFLTNTAWAVHSTYHTVLKTLSGMAIFGRKMLFDIPFLADWSKIEEYRLQAKTNGQEYCQRKQWPYRLGLSPR